MVHLLYKIRFCFEPFSGSSGRNQNHSKTSETLKNRAASRLDVSLDAALPSVWNPLVMVFCVNVADRNRANKLEIVC